MRNLVPCAAAFVLSLASCSKPPEAHPPVAAPSKPKAPLRDPGVPSLHATELARVPSATYGPYLAARPDGGLAVWAANQGAERHFQLVPLSVTGRPLGTPRNVGTAPAEMGLVLVRPTPAGYALLYTRQGPSREELLEFACFSSDGKRLDEAAQSDPLSVSTLPGRALWLEVVPVSGGSLVFYATRASGARLAEIRARRLDSVCKLGPPELIESQALAWQATPLGDGALLTAMRPATSGQNTAGQNTAGQNQNAGSANTRSVWGTSVSGEGKLKRAAPVIAALEADLDLDAAQIDGNVVLAFTDRRALDPHVLVAALDANQKLVREPAALTPKEGEQALVRLVSAAPGTKQGYVAFESFTQAGSRRYISLSALNGAGELTGRRVELAYDKEEGEPEFFANAQGLAALTSARPCAKSGPCNETSSVPLFVAFDSALEARAIEPLRLDALRGGVAELAFGLGCAGSGCFAIAALSRVPAPLYATELGARSNVWQPPFAPPPRSARPRVLEHEAVAELESLAGFALADSGKDHYLAYVTDFDSTTPWKRLTKPAPDGRFEPLRATVGLELGTPNQEPMFREAPFSPISLRAQSLANVALAPADVTSGDVLMAWGGVDAGRAQLFATLLGKGGTKRAQRMLTRGKADIADIALTFVGDGWVVAWVDERSSDPEVYAQKLDKKLNLVGPEQRITRTPGAALDLALQFDGKNLLLAWSDARASADSGEADIYVQRLRPRDAGPEADALRVSETAGHSFGPSLARTAAGFVLAWVERARDGEAGSVAVAELDANLALKRSKVPSGPGEPRAVALDCPDAGGCHLVALLETENGAALYGSSRAEPGFSKLEPLIGLDGSVVTSVRPVLSGENVYFADRADAGTRVRRARVEW